MDPGAVTSSTFWAMFAVGSPIVALGAVHDHAVDIPRLAEHVLGVRELAGPEVAAMLSTQ